MPHKLLIEFEIESEPILGRHAESLDVIQGSTYRLRLFITNLGTLVFPGSDSMDIKIHYRIHGVMESYSYPDEAPSCPEIKPGKKLEVFSDKFTALDEGTAWVIVNMKARDGEKIIYCQSPTSELSSDFWQKWFFVLSKEYSYLVAKLDDIAKKLE